MQNLAEQTKSDCERAMARSPAEALDCLTDIVTLCECLGDAESLAVARGYLARLARLGAE